ncbi:class I SAM-dependent methyltransferase [Geitlerinema calcuttense]|uniref:Class I SAM-dependent methyltransferase n=1 Tax=Geitlerinema calcuttense NRMC-F 0142 TaxID=2922238 RepID=A0ABT7LY74_9CYAN|nr:class I SAM-dependent methyltransferase [Geitlerinema calcuttense]MDL5056966.1 class I SAM-dependent methyltransferase [Geitlerinema calcuttense NRMC-F 0142]
MPYSTYEESVMWLRSQPQYSEFVRSCYLDQDNLLAARRFLSSEEFSEIIKILGLVKPGRHLKILDLGCGNGIASYAFSTFNHAVYAVDPDPSREVGLEATRRLSNSSNNGLILTFNASAESLPFSDNFFDIVYERQALHHFSDLNKGLTEVSRVLKPGGFLLATREHVVNDEQQLRDFLQNHLLHQMHGGENAYRLDEYLLAFRKANLKISRYWGCFDTVINHYPTSNLDIRSWFIQALENKFGKIGASYIAKVPLLETLYRRALSQSNQSPGRLYSFLCVKPKGKKLNENSLRWANIL